MTYLLHQTRNNHFPLIHQEANAQYDHWDLVEASDELTTLQPSLFPVWHWAGILNQPEIHIRPHLENPLVLYITQEANLQNIEKSL